MSEIVGEQALGRVEKTQTGPIVNLWAVGVACLSIVVLIVTIAENWLWGLDFFHVVGGGVFGADGRVPEERAVGVDGDRHAKAFLRFADEKPQV